MPTTSDDSVVDDWNAPARAERFDAALIAALAAPVESDAAPQRSESGEEDDWNVHESEPAGAPDPGLDPIEDDWNVRPHDVSDAAVQPNGDGANDDVQLVQVGDAAIVPAPPQLATPACRGGRGVRKAALKRAAAAESSALVPAPPPGAIPHITALVAKTFDAFLPANDAALVATWTARAEGTGTARRTLKRHLWETAYGSYHFVRGRITSLISAALDRCKIEYSETREIASHTQPLLFVRRRKYDEAEMNVTVDTPFLALEDEGQDMADKTLGPHKMFVIEGAFGYTLRRSRIADGASKMLTLLGAVPTRLSAIEATNGEIILQCVEQGKLGIEQRIDDTFYRQLGVVCSDEHSANLRAERFDDLQLPTSHGKVTFICDAHKKAAVLKYTRKALDPIDTQVIRLQLSMRGIARRKIKQAMRQIIRTQFCVKHNAPPLSAEAVAYNEEVWKTFLIVRTAHDAYRLAILRRLFNDDLRIRGSVPHREVGCCKTPRHTLRLMLTVGTDSIVPDLSFGIMQRDNWTGSSQSIEAFGLGCFVHGVFDQGCLLVHAEIYFKVGAAGDGDDADRLAIQDGRPPDHKDKAADEHPSVFRESRDGNYFTIGNGTRFGPDPGTSIPRPFQNSPTPRSGFWESQSGI